MFEHGWLLSFFLYALLLDFYVRRIVYDTRLLSFLFLVLYRFMNKRLL